MKKKLGKICIYGCFKDSELYPRNRVLITALSEFFNESVEIRPYQYTAENSLNTPSSSMRKIFTSLSISLAGLQILYKQRHELRDASLYYVPYPAYIDLLFLRLFTFRNHRRVAIDSFLCLYDTIVNDRKLIRHNSIMARGIRWLEKNTLRKADLIFIDTEQQKKLLLDSYNLEEKKLVVTPVGIDEKTWTELPMLPLSDQFRVLFWGTFIPLHGLETIVDAARIVARKDKSIKITLIGDGQAAEEIAVNLNTNPIDTLEWKRELMETKFLRSQVEKAHCILGIFGTSKKAANVIPYKAYQAMASNKILITREGAALHQLFGDAQDVPGLRLVPAGSAEALAEEILQVRRNYHELSENPCTGLAYNSRLSNRLLCENVGEALNGLGL